MRDKGFTNASEDLENKAKEITEKFSKFTDGFRVLMLLQRTKDGGHNDEDKRIFESFTTTNPEEFELKLFYLLLIKNSSNAKTRIYLSLNSRNPKKVIRYIEEQLLEAHYADDAQRDSVYKKLLKKPRHFLMQQSCKTSSLFIIDVDDEEGKDNQGIAIKKIYELGLIEIQRYATKNGWHYIVEPFNLGLWDCVGEVKKDSLILLDY